MTKQYNTTLQTPSTGIVFTKFPSVMDSLCNHKEAATRWADGEDPICACSALRQHSLYSLSPQRAAQHLVIDGDALRFADAPFTSIATGSLQNKIFPPSKEIYNTLRSALTTWTTRTPFPHYHAYTWTIYGQVLFNLIIPHSTTTSPTRTLYVSNNFSRRRSFTMKTNELHPFEFTADDLLPVPHQDLRRSDGLSEIGGRPKPHY